MAIATETRRIPMSLEEFERIPEGPPFYDYIDGEAIELNKATGKHMDIELELAHHCKQHIRARKLGRLYCQIDVRLPTGNWVGPDIVFIAAEHLDRYDEEKGDLMGAPDLAVEITSPSTEVYDRIEKMEQYRLSAVPWVWIVGQVSLAIEEFELTPEGYLRASVTPAGEIFRPRLFPGLEINLQALLAEA